MTSLEDTESPKKKQRLNSSPPPPPQFKCSFRTHTCPEILKHGGDYTELELREGALNHNQPEGVIYDTPVCGETVDGHIFCFWCDSEARQGDTDSDYCLHVGCAKLSTASTEPRDEESTSVDYDDAWLLREYCELHRHLIEKEGRKWCFDLDDEGCSCVLTDSGQCPGHAAMIDAHFRD